MNRPLSPHGPLVTRSDLNLQERAAIRLSLAIGLAGLFALVLCVSALSVPPMGNTRLVAVLAP